MADRTVSVRITAMVSDYQKALGQAEQSTKKFGSTTLDMAKKNEQHFNHLGIGAVAAGTAIMGGLGLAAKAAMNYESAFAGVTKTVDGTQAQMAGLSEGIRAMAREMPASAVEIAGVAEAAGALGVRTEDILGFTRVMVDLGETTNLTSEQAATSMARFMNIMGTAGEDVDELGSTLVELGNNGASTEAEIMELGLRLAGAGKQAGLSESDVLGFANALSSMGIEAEAGGSAFSRVFIKINDAVIDGGEKLDTFAKVAGMSAEEFRTAYEDDAAGAITTFVAGLGQVQASGQSTTAILDSLELGELRVSDALRRTAGNSDLLAKSLADGSRAWEENIALTAEAEKRYATSEARMAIAVNQLTDFGIEIGGVVLPAVAALVGAGGDLAEMLSSLPGPAKTAVGIVGSLSGVALLAGGGFLLLLPKIAATREALNALGLSGTRAGTALSTLGKATGIALGIVGVAVALDQLQKSLNAPAGSVNELSGGLVDLARGAMDAAPVVGLLGDDVGDLSQMVKAAGANKLNIFDMIGVQEIDTAKAALERLDSALAGLATSGHADVAGEAMERLRDKYQLTDAQVESLMGRLPQYGEALAGLATEEKLAGDAAEAGAGSTEALSGAMEELNDVTGESIVMSEAEAAAREAQMAIYKEMAASLAGFVDPMDALNTVLERSTETSRAHAEGIAESTADAGDSWEDYVGDATVSLGEFAAELQKQIDAQDNWANNLRIIAGRGREDVARELMKMGPEGAALVAEFANGTEVEMNRAGDLLVESARRGGMEAGEALDIQLKVMGEIARQGAGATVQSVAESLGVLPGEVARLAEEANVALRDAEAGWNESWARRTRLTLDEMETLKNEAPPKVRTAAEDINRYLADNHPEFVEQMRSRRGVSVDEMNALLRDAPPPVRAAADIMNNHLRDTKPAFDAGFIERKGLAWVSMDQMRRDVPPLAYAAGVGMKDMLWASLGAFKGVVGSYQNALVAGIKAVSIAARGATGGLAGGASAMAHGGIVEFYAQGGMKEKHQAQIARAGDWRVWAEPETGGEAYIPLSPNKRDRSTAILREVADRFGMSLRDMRDLPEGVDYHDGGLYVPPGAPGLPSHGPPIRPAGEQTMENARAFTAEWAKRHMQEEHHQMPQVSGGKALARVQSVLGDFPSLRITSTYRSPARNAAAGGAKNSYHMDRNNPAVDIGGPTRELDRLHAVLKKAGGWRELLWRVRGHYDHVHAAEEGGIFNPYIRDNGGPLMPGFTFNGTGRPESVIPASGANGLDMADLKRAVAAAVGAEVAKLSRPPIHQTFNQPISPQRVARELSRELV